jgi:hypothetical protein
MPRKHDDDDDDDLPPVRKSELTGLDAMFANTSVPVLVLFGCCCGWIAVILSVVALVTCKDETAKKNALIVLIVAAVIGVLHTVSVIIRLGAAGAGRGGF